MRRAAEKKEDFKRKVVQKKLTQNWLQIPEREKEKFRSEEEKRKRLELKEVKENLWRWRNKPEDKVGKKRKMGDRKEKEFGEDQLRKIEEIIERVKVEDKIENERREKYQKEKEKIRAERSRNKEKMKVEEEDRRERLRKKRKLEQRWEMTRWIKLYIDKNSDRWEIEKIEREEIRRKKLLDWDKTARFQKIRMIKMKRAVENMGKETKLDEVEKYSNWSEYRELLDNENDKDGEEEKGSDVVKKIEVNNSEKIKEETGSGEVQDEQNDQPKVLGPQHGHILGQGLVKRELVKLKDGHDHGGGLWTGEEHKKKKEKK